MIKKIYTLEKCVAFKDIRRILIVSEIREDVVRKLEENHKKNEKEDVFYDFKVCVNGKVKWRYTFYKGDEVKF
ncbi:hypothetical protein COM95_29390 [Bacillus cereus]|nr:hypothetical protein COM95_29390 [Bacillus cereus]PFH68791.1 hypothetical protein COI61_27815 [Bacillus cereus]